MADLPFDAMQDWEFVTSFLPEDWREQAFALRALWRRRKITDPGTLLRVLLVHVGHGLSMRETAVRCREAGLTEISDVSILHRLRVSGAWTGYLCRSLAESLRSGVALEPSTRRLLAVDATTVREPGPTGSCWRLHYTLNLASGCCEQAEVTSAKGAERLSRFAFGAGDLVFADRGYSRPSDIAHILTSGAHVVLRFKYASMLLLDGQGQPFDPLVALRELADGAVGDYPVQVVWGDRPLAGRLCAVRKRPDAARRERRKIQDRRRRKGTRLGRPATDEMASYFVVFTTEPATGASAGEILSWYSWRWQIEICFKRLKGIFDVGHLPKHDPRSVLAWMQLKLLTALLAEAMRRHAESFSPWGYPLG